MEAWKEVDVDGVHTPVPTGNEASLPSAAKLHLNSHPGAGRVLPLPWLGLKPKCSRNLPPTPSHGDGAPQAGFALGIPDSSPNLPGGLPRFYFH